jgi:small subunit ribosomal protein S8
MTMQDTLADMLIRIKNAHSRAKKTVAIPASKLKSAVLAVLKEEGYITDYALEGEGVKQNLLVTLKYYQGEAVIETLKRVSRPSLRIYRGCKAIPKSNNGLGITIVSTPKGVMTGSKASHLQIGGEVLCTVF